MITSSDTLESSGPAESGQKENPGQVREQVRQLLQRLFTRDPGIERRADGRFPFPFLCRLTPVEENRLVPIADPLVVIGKDLSERGFGFFHKETLPYRRVVISIDRHREDTIEMLLDLSWCRFTSYGWYESGGRFVQVLSPGDVSLSLVSGAGEAVP